MSMRKIPFILALCSFLLIGCMANTHVIGTGGGGGQSISKRQLYVIALVPLNHVDTNAMAEGAANYTIATKQDVVDIIINGVTMGIISSRKVTVSK